MVAIISTASQAQANNGANPTNNKGSITRLTRVGDRTREGHSGHKNLPCSIITEIKKGSPGSENNKRFAFQLRLYSGGKALMENANSLLGLF